jgi:protein SCO1/2
MLTTMATTMRSSITSEIIAAPTATIRGPLRLSGVFSLAFVLACAGCANFQDKNAGPSREQPSAQIISRTPSARGSISSIDSEWQADDGARVRLADFNGRLRVVSMFYSTCEGVCRLTLQDMQMIEASLSAATRERVLFILVTLDPAADTPEALRSYRAAENLAPNRWALLRGDLLETRQLSNLLQVRAGRDSSGRFIHSSQLVVVDESGNIFDIHDGTQANLRTITRELEHLSTPRASSVPAPHPRG